MEKQNYKNSLYWWNICVTCVHWSSFIALTAISTTRLDTVRRVALYFDSGKTSLGTYPLFATLIPFPFITGLFHIFAAYNVDNYYYLVLKRGVNRLRWIEYAITNGLMTWSLCLLVRAGSILIPILCVFANFTMQTYGWWHERRNHMVKREYQSLGPLLLGFIPWLVVWATILAYWIAHVDTSTISEGFAVIGSFVLSLFFVFPLLWRYNTLNTIENNYKMEIAYIVLSLTAKLWLDWTLTIGNLVE
jgi:hypothetical protein